jgi:Tol biopolymer transport system component
MKTQTLLFRKTMPFIFLLGLLVSAAPLPAASNVKLSGVMPVFGDVTDFRISPDGRVAVYKADQDTDGVFELYSVLLGSGIPVRLSSLLVSGRSVANFGISPDSSRVVFRADQDTQGVIELYSVPIGGPAAAGTKLNVPLPPGGRASGDISPDSSRVIYTADHQAVGVFELFSVPIAGPATDVIKLNGVLPPGGRVNSFKISPDSSRVIYGADQDQAGRYELYSVPQGGPTGSGVKLNGNLISGGTIYGWQISPDSRRVVYQADQLTVGARELFSVPIGGPATEGIKLNGTLVPGGYTQGWQINADSSRVVYDARQNGVLELFSILIGGPTGSEVKINGALVLGGQVDRFRISPDGHRTTYMADQQTAGRLDLFSVLTEGPAASGVKLNSVPVTGGHVWDFQISPDSRRVVYTADQDALSILEIYSVPIGGPETVGFKLNGILITGGKVDSFQFTPNSNRVVYLADQQIHGLSELHSVPLGGPAAAGSKVNGPLVGGGHVSSFQVSPDSGRVLYIADQDTNGVFELYMTSNYSLHLPLILRQH